MKLFSFDLNLNSLKRPKESKLFLALAPVLKEKRTQQATSLALTFITIAFFGLFAINPTLGTITDLQKQLDDSTFVNNALTQKIANLTSLQSQYAQVQPLLDPVFVAVPANSGIDTFVGQIHQLALSTGIQLNRVETLPLDISATALTTARYLSFAFTIEAQGDLPSLQKYMVQLASFDRLISFDTVTYTRVGLIDTTFRATYRGSVYFKPNSNL